MSGTNGEEPFQGYDSAGEEKLGLSNDLSSFEVFILKENVDKNENVCPQCL